MNTTFSSSYGSLEAIRGYGDMVRVAAPAGTIFTVPMVGNDFGKFRAQLLEHISNRGLVDAAEHYGAYFSPRAASIVEHYFSDMLGMDIPTEKPVSRDVNEDHKDKRKPPAPSFAEGGEKDDQEARDKPGKEVPAKAVSDYARPRPTKTTITEGGESDQGQEGRDKGPKTAIDDEIVDRKTAQAEDLPDFLEEVAEEPADDESATEDDPFEDEGDAKTTLTIELDLGDGIKEVEIEGEDVEGEDGVKTFEITKATCEGEDCTEEVKASEEARELIDIALSETDELTEIIDNTESEMAPADDPGEDSFLDDILAAFDAEPCEDCGKLACECGGMEKTATCDHCGDADCKGCEGHDKHARRIAALYRSRMRKLKAEFQAKEKEIARRIEARWLSALDLAARRQLLNLAHSPLKEAFGGTLCNPMRINASEDYAGMDPDLAVHLIETASARGFRPFVASLVKDARELMAMPKPALDALRRDAARLQPADPRTAAYRQAQSADEYGMDPDDEFSPDHWDVWTGGDPLTAPEGVDSVGKMTKTRGIGDSGDEEIDFDDIEDDLSDMSDHGEADADLFGDDLGEFADDDGGTDRDAWLEDLRNTLIIPDANERAASLAELARTMPEEFRRDPEYAALASFQGSGSMQDLREAAQAGRDLLRDTFYSEGPRPGAPRREYVPSAPPPSRMVAERTRREAAAGNFEFAPAPPSVPNNDKGVSIRQALSFTKVSSLWSAIR